MFIVLVSNPPVRDYADFGKDIIRDKIRIAQAIGVVVEPINGIAPTIFAEASTNADLKHITAELEKAW